MERDDFGDDVADVPFNQELYNELIPEMSEHREESASFYSKNFLAQSKV